MVPRMKVPYVFGVIEALDRKDILSQTYGEEVNRKTT